MPSASFSTCQRSTNTRTDDLAATDKGNPGFTQASSPAGATPDPVRISGQHRANITQLLDQAESRHIVSRLESS
jgi:hypothetical protein